MVSIHKLNRYLNRLLDIRKLPDMSRNGLQARNCKEVSSVAAAVDASLETIEKARNEDLLIVHHGILWRGQRDKLGLKKKYLEKLKENSLSLYACHLPLDLHAQLGNNIELARLLSLVNIRRFGYYHGISIGYEGELPKAMSIKRIRDYLQDKMGDVRLFSGRPKRIKSIAIVSGGGSSAFVEAAKKGIDLFITGEAPHHVTVHATDLCMNMLLCGHYQTETFGVKALGRHIQETFKIPYRFIRANETRR